MRLLKYPLPSRYTAVLNDIIFVLENDFVCVYAAGDELSGRGRLPGRRGELRPGVGNGGKGGLGDNRGEGGHKKGERIRAF